MDATALTVVGTGVALFVALWKVQGNRFDAVDKRFDMAEKLNRERFEMGEKLNRERFDMAETQNRERSEAMDRRWTERFDMAEKQNQAAHAVICNSIGKVDQRLDDLYRHLLGTRAKTDLSGPAPAAG